MKHTILAILAILSIVFTVQAQTDCYNEGKAKIAKDNMDEGDDGLTCANAGKFYTKLCLYKTEPLTVEQGNTLKKELQVIKKAYNDYGVYCKDIGRIDEVIPDKPTITLVDEEETTTEDILVEATINALGGSINSSGGSSGNCNTAGRNKFSNTSFSSSGAESAANQYEGYRCHCINGTAQRQFDGSEFSVNQLKNLRQNYYTIKSSSDPNLSPLPSKCADSPRSEISKENKSTVAQYYNRTPRNLQESFIQEFNPQGYAYYKYSKGIAEQGKRITEGLLNQLNNYSKLIESSNPEVLLADFNQKMTNIENLEQSYMQESFNFGQQRGAELVNQINSGDHLGALTNAVNTISTFANMNKADRAIAEKKEKLRKQQIQQMSNVYWKAIEANDEMIDNYMKRAAYAEDIRDEEYNLSFVENLECYAKKMDANWSTTSTSWLNNTCAKPTKPDASIIQNLLTDRDVQMKDIAQRKLKLYERTTESVFLDAAISYAAAAVNINPTAQNFYYLGQLYRRNSMMLAYANLLAAKETDSSFFDDSKNEILNLVKKAAKKEVASAIQENNVDYIKSFLTVGLDRTILLNNRDLLTEVIRIDNPDAVQVILNEYIKDLSPEKRSEKIKKAIMLCAAQNSIKTLKRFQELKINTDFQLNGYKPVQIAAKANAVDAYSLLSGNNRLTTSDKNFSSVKLLVNAKKNPKEVAETIDKMASRSSAQTLITKMVKDLNDKPFYIDVLAICEECLTYATSNEELQKILKLKFADELLIASPKSNAHKYISSGLIKFNVLPTYNDLFENTSTLDEKEITKSSLIDLRLSLNELITESYDNAFKAGLSKTAYDSFQEYHTRRFKSLNEYKYQDIPLSIVEERKIAANIYLEYDNLSVTNLYPKLEDIAYNKYKTYVLSHYHLKEKISVEFKMNKIRKTLNKSNLNPNEKWLLKDFQTLNKRIEQWGIDDEKERSINKIYIYCALLENHPMDKSHLEYLFDKELILEEENNYPKNENIIFVAFDRDNFELFSAIDKQFDLSRVTNKNFVSLKDYVFNNERAITSKAYYSEDFDIKKTKEILWQQLSNLINEIPSIIYESGNNDSKNLIANKTNELLKTFDFTSVNDKISKTGGTLLHWIIDDALVQAKGFNYDAKEYVPLISSLDINKSIKDNNGQTAYEYLEKQKRAFKNTKFVSSNGKVDTGKQMYAHLEELLN